MLYRNEETLYPFLSDPSKWTKRGLFVIRRKPHLIAAITFSITLSIAFPIDNRNSYRNRDFENKKVIVIETLNLTSMAKND